jgi:hypothetical protein
VAYLPTEARNTRSFHSLLDVPGHKLAGTIAEARRLDGHDKDELTVVSHNFCVFSVALSLALAPLSPASPISWVARTGAGYRLGTR